METLLTVSRESGTRTNLTQVDNEFLESILTRNNFSPELQIADFKDSRYQQLSISVSTSNIAPRINVQSREITILEASNPTDASTALAAQLTCELENQSFQTKRIKWNSNFGEITGKECVSLIETSTSLLDDLTEEDFLKMKQIVTSASSLLWVTILDNPAAALSVGMARSICNEVSRQRFRTLSVEGRSLQFLKRLATLLTRLIVSSSADSEFIEDYGILKVGRVMEDKSMNAEMAYMTTEASERIKLIPLDEAQGPQKLAIKAQGMLDSLYLESDHVQSHIEDDEVLVEVKATGLK